MCVWVYTQRFSYKMNIMLPNLHSNHNCIFVLYYLAQYLPGAYLASISSSTKNIKGILTFKKSTVRT